MRLTRLITTRVAPAVWTGLCLAAGTVSATAGTVPATAATAATAATTSKAQLIIRADDICRRVNTQAAPFQARVTRLASAEHPNYTAMAAALNESNAVEQQGLRQLRALPAPAADRAAATKLWNELGTVVSASQAISQGVARQNITAVNRATQRKLGAEAVYRRLAKRFGLTYCGN